MYPGLPLFGVVIPFPPAPVLWVVAALDLVVTIWVWRRPWLWGVVAAGLVVSAYLTIVGIFSIGPIYFVLLICQLVRLITWLTRTKRNPPR